jgi:hypothetical protein
MLSAEALFKAKREYGTILVQEIGTTIYTFRLLSPEDYRLVIHPGSIDETDIEEIVCDICVLDPNPIDTDELGYGVSDLAELIIQESGLQTPEELLESMKRIREEIATDSLDFIIANICSAFPTYNPDELERKPVPKLLKLLAMAEKIGGKEIITPQLFKKMKRGTPTMGHPPSPTNIEGTKFNARHVSEEQETNMATSTDALANALEGKIK